MRFDVRADVEKGGVLSTMEQRLCVNLDVCVSIV